MSELTITPTLDEFIELGAASRVVSVCAKIQADQFTPIALFQRLCADSSDSFLLESVEQTQHSRWTFVGVHCAARLVVNHGQATWQFPGRRIDGLPHTGTGLQILNQTLSLLQTPAQASPDTPPFTSGMVGYIGYDMIRTLETLPCTVTDDRLLPDMVMMLASDMAILDHYTGCVWLIANAINFDDDPHDIAQAWQTAVDRIHAMARALNTPITPQLRTLDPRHHVEIERSCTSEEFIELVERAKEYIFAGDIFQVVPSQRFEIQTQASALDIYRQLRLTNPSPYLYLVNCSNGDHDFSLIGSSPEALVRVNQRTAVTRPIAGTRRRGHTEAEDLALEEELRNDEKERAEHIMLVDLGRNDLGKVCKPGTVEVTELLNVHRYSHVMHLEASVRGQLNDDASSLDATMACFPAGTLSGAPKLRAMEIIDELEDYRRGPYAGVVGYFDFAGNSDAAIGIRTAVLTEGRAYIQAGAGIVADSVGELEDKECRNKAAAVVQAVLDANATIDLDVQGAIR